MKRNLILIFMITTLVSLATAAEITADSEIKKVTVYQDRALIIREAVVNLNGGENILIFDNLPAGIDSGSLQVKGFGNAVLQDIQYKTVYYTIDPDERIQLLIDQLQVISDDKTNLQDAINRAQSEKLFMEKITNRVTSPGENESVEMDTKKWIEMVDFYRSRTSELDREIRKDQIEIRNKSNLEQKLRKELNSLSRGGEKSRNQARLVLQAEGSTPAKILLSYLVYGPTWYPDYDIRVDSSEKNVSLAYNARILQNTGEDWNGVELSLSTATPHIYGKHPDLSPWYLYLYRQEVDSYYASSSRGMEKSLEDAPMEQMMNMMDEELSVGLEKKEIDILRAEIKTGATAVQFVTQGTYTIASDNLSHKVNILTQDFPASFRYSTVPKLSSFAYLKTKIVNETDFPLLAGSSKVFLDGAFVANSQVPQVAPGEEFWTFLGIDESIKVEYKQISQQKEKTRVFGKTEKVTYHYEIKITNRKKTTEDIVIWDQLPIPQDKDIKVTLLEPDYKEDTEHLKMNNDKMIEWFRELAPGEEIILTLKYTVEYPKDAYIEGL